MRALLSIAVVLAVPRPAGAKMSIAKAAAAVCRCEGLGDAAEDVLTDAGPRSVGPLLHAIASFPEVDDDCTHQAYELAVQLLCNDQQYEVHGNRVTPAVLPVRAALASADWVQVSLALEILAGLRPPPLTQTNHLRSCDTAEPILASAAGDLGRLLDRTQRKRREQVLSTIEGLKLNGAGARLVPALVRVLDDGDFRDRAAMLLTTIGPPARPAVPRLAQLFARASDLRLESIYAAALGAIGAPSPASAAVLPALLDQAAQDLCSTPRRFFTLFRAAVASGPPPDQSRPVWESEIVSRAAFALARIGSTCSQPMIERNLIVALARLPRGPAQVVLLESEMANPTASIDRRFWSAWALRKLGVPLPSPQAAAQTELLAPAEPLPAAPEPEAPLDHLFSHEIWAGMRALDRLVADCYARHHVSGFATVNVEIAYGRVTSATVTGTLAGTPSGACLERVVRTARFPLRERVSTGVPFTLK